MRLIGIGILAAAAALAAGAASASALPAGEWSCFMGPTWAKFSAGGEVAAPSGQRMSQLWIFDAHRYASETQDDAGRYELSGDHIVGLSGPFQRVPMSAHFAAQGLAGKPTIFLSWSTAPSVSLVCQPTAG